MVQIILVGFFPDDHGRTCEMHPYGCGNVHIKDEGNGVGHLICLHLVEKVHLVGYAVQSDGTDGCRVCFAAQEYASGETARQLGSSLLKITEVFLCNSPNKSMWVLYHCNLGYVYVEAVEM